MSKFSHLTVTASGTTLADGLPISKNSQIVQITTSTSTNNSLVLPLSDVRQEYSIRNDAEHWVAVFPPNSVSCIDGLADGEALYINSHKSQVFRVASRTNVATPVMRYMSSGTQNEDEQTQCITGAVTLSQKQSGTTFFVSQASAYTITLPAVATSGNCKFDFIVDVAGANEVLILSNGTVMSGSIHTGPIGAGLGTILVDANATSVTFGTTDLAGDRLSIISNGTLWLCQGLCGSNVSATGMIFDA